MDLTFQVPMQYCSLQHWTVLSPPDTSTAGHCFCFGSASSFILKLFPSSILDTYQLGRVIIFQFHISLPFHTVHGVLKAKILKWFAIPISSKPCFSELSTMTCPFWVALHSMAGEGNGTPLQYSCLENPMDGGAWWAAVHEIAKSQAWLRDCSFAFHFHTLEKEMATHSSVLAWRIPGTGEPGGLPSLGSHRVGHD